MDHNGQRTEVEVALVLWGQQPMALAAALGVRAFMDRRPDWHADILPVSIGRDRPDHPSLQRAHGIIGFFSGTRSEAGIARLKVPTVKIAGSANSDAFARVLPDNRDVGRLAARHLLDASLRHFAFVGISGQTYARDRRDGFVAEITGDGYDVAVWEEGELAGLGRWLEGLPRPVGVLAEHDNMARLTIDACTDRSLNVPQDVAVVGVGNDEVLCRLSRTPISSVDTASTRVGYRAAELLDAMLGGAATPGAPVLVPPLGVVERASSDVLLLDDPLAAAALRLIRSRACRGISAGAVAEAVGVSRRTLERVLRKHTGRTPHEEIRQTQFRRACRLLVTEDAKLADVARRCGFALASSFMREFRRHFGETPTEYRRRNSMLA